MACSLVTSFDHLDDGAPDASANSDSGDHPYSDADAGGAVEGSPDAGGMTEGSARDADAGSATEEGASDATNAAETSDGAPPTYAAVVRADHPRAYWRLGDTAGSTSIKDEMGNYPGAPKGGLTLGSPGAIVGDNDTAIRFSAGAIDVDASFDFVGNAPFTIEVWANPTTIDGEYRALLGNAMLSQPPDANSRQGYALWLQQPDGLGFERDRDGKSGSTVLVIKNGGIPMTRFSHVVATYDGTWLLLYVDGKLVDSRTAQEVLVALPPPFSLGHVGANAFSAGFIGTLDEAAIYDRALDAGVVAAHCAAGRGWPDGGC